MEVVVGTSVRGGRYPGQRADGEGGGVTRAEKRKRVEVGLVQGGGRGSEVSGAECVCCVYLNKKSIYDVE